MMNSTRSRAAVGAALLTVTFCLFSAGSTQAQSNKLTATIPFGFHTADKLLPAGQYEVQTFGNGAMKLYNRETRTSILFQTNRVSSLTRSSSPSFIFNRYGEDYFLSQMWWGDGSDGNALSYSRVERELARTIEPVRVAVSVRH
jgi:hypothetical protein